ncbi:MAG TPA: hypothetical protein VGF35_06530, partial [Steroidobacteraceae bacterium]
MVWTVRARAVFLGGLLSSGALAAGAARADPAREPADTAGYDLQEVVVQARRRAETLLEVPLAETVKTGAELQSESAVLFADLAQGVPNMLAFKSARSVSALEVTIRGQTALPSSIVYDPAVGLYIDGV